MKKDTQKRINDYVELFEEIQKKAPSEEVSIAILQEIGKDKRSKGIFESTESKRATEKQKSYLKDLGIEFNDSITKKEAWDLIENNKSC